MLSNRFFLPVLALFCLLFGPDLFAATPVASIDRNVISVDDTLTLTIHIDDTGSYDSPDTSVLDQDFYVLGSSQSSRHSYINGVSKSSTEWIVSLMPKHTGTLRIPPITVGNKKTSAVSVFVRDSAPQPANSGEPIFMQSEVSSDSVYVQQQLIFTVRVFQSVQLDNMTLSDIDIDDALVEKLSQDSFQRNINGRTYRVHEIRYAIFPQKSGSFTIPEVVFSANELTAQRGFFNLPGQGRPVRKMTRQHEIKVLPAPASFAQQADNPWLPAQEIKLEESWSSDPDDIHVGDSVTRTITLNAKGLLGSQLPPYTFHDMDGARFYPDKGKTENNLTAQGADSVRKDSAAIIPTRKGKLTFPAITVSWWDTHSNTIRKAVIPAHTIDVKPAPAGAAATNAPESVDHSQPLENPAPTVAASPPGDSRLWQVLTAVFAILWLITLWLWWQARQRPAPVKIEKSAVKSPPGEKQLFKQLQTACRDNDAKAAREALLQWGQAFWPQHNIRSLQDIERECDNPELTTVILQLEHSLYGAGSASIDWNGEVLLSALNKIREGGRKQQARNQLNELPPLYNHQ